MAVDGKEDWSCPMFHCSWVQKETELWQLYIHKKVYIFIYNYIISQEPHHATSMTIASVMHWPSIKTIIIELYNKLELLLLPYKYI